MSIDSNAKIISVVGGCRRSGRWIVPEKTKMITLFGRAIIDLREAQTSAEELEFSCLSVFANITFLVPDGAEVRPSGIAILGSSRSTVPLSTESCPLPPMSVDATTAFGRLRIRTTDHEPDDAGERRRFWRRRRSTTQPAEGESVPLPTDAPPPVPAPGMDMADTVRSVASAAEATQLPGASSRPNPPEPVQPATSTPVEMPPYDLSAPIERFPGDDDHSPIHGVAPPADLSDLDDPRVDRQPQREASVTATARTAPEASNASEAEEGAAS